MLQDPAVTTNPFAQPLIRMAFLCALASLCHGVVLYVYVSKMRTMPKIINWATVG